MNRPDVGLGKLGHCFNMFCLKARGDCYKTCAFLPAWCVTQSAPVRGRSRALHLPRTSSRRYPLKVRNPCRGVPRAMQHMQGMQPWTFMTRTFAHAPNYLKLKISSPSWIFDLLFNIFLFVLLNLFLDSLLLWHSTEQIPSSTGSCSLANAN